MVTFFKNNGFALLVALLCIAAPELALAAGGADTGASTGNNIKSWLDTWIPIACTIGVIGVVPRLAVPSYFRWFYVPSRNRNGWHWLRIISGIPDWYRQLINGGEYIPIK